LNPLEMTKENGAVNIAGTTAGYSTTPCFVFSHPEKSGTGKTAGRIIGTDMMVGVMMIGAVMNTTIRPGVGTIPTGSGDLAVLRRFGP
jgi:hypothetical protein